MPEPRYHVFYPSHEGWTTFLVSVAAAQLIFNLLVVQEKLLNGLKEWLKRLASQLSLDLCTNATVDAQATQ